MEGKSPINLRFGSQRVQLGYEIRRPDGTTILAAGIPGLGLHLSLHPSGVIKLSDRFGFERRIDVGSPEVIEAAEEALEDLVEDLLDSVEEEPEFDEDVMAFGNFGEMQGRVMRRTPYGLDINPLGAFKAAGFGFPFVFVDADAVTRYLEIHPANPTLLLAPKSQRVVIAQETGKTMSFEFDLRDPLKLVRRFPLGRQLTEAFVGTFDYMRNAKETLGVDPIEYLESRMRALDAELLTKEAMRALGYPTQPIVKRFTTEGFEPLQL